jgi:hypothetical protein
MKKTHSKSLALRTQTVANLSADDLRTANGGSASLVGFTTQLNTAGFTSQLSTAAWTFTIDSKV